MPQLNLSTFPTQLFWLVIIFAALYFIVSKVSLPAIADVLQTRQERIISDLDKAEGMKLDAENLEKEYENSLVSSQVKARAVIAEAKSRIGSISTKKHIELDEILAFRFEEASGKIETSRNEALKEIASVSSDLSRVITNSIAGINITGKEADNAVESILNTENNISG